MIEQHKLKNQLGRIPFEAWVALILILSFIFRLIVFYNTTLFSFHDFKTYLNAVDAIAQGKNVPLISGNFLFLNSYLGHFFKYVLGNIDLYFIFICFLGTASSYIIYRTVILLCGNRKIALISILIQLFYTEFIVWSSVFYTPIIGIFLLSLVLLLIVLLLQSKDLLKTILYSVLIILIINFSFYFKGEMKYFYLLFIILALINFKKKDILLKFLSLGIVLFITTSILFSVNILPSDKSGTEVNDFIFYGHTMYGGDGGDGSFVYKENEDRYYVELDKYCLENNIPDSLKKSIDVRNEFQKAEIIKFVKEHPFRWLKLQGYKFFRFFGVVPEGTASKILITGMFKDKLLVTAVFLVLPVALILLGVIVLLDHKALFRAIKKPKYQILLLILGYYIFASVFFGQYQERYRIPIMVCMIIPYLSWSIYKYSWKNFIQSKPILIARSLMVVLLIIIWLSQAYHVAVVQKDRYLGAVKELEINTIDEK